MDSRSLTLADAEELTELIRRFEVYWKVPIVTTVAQVEEDLTAPFVDIDRDTRGFWLDGRMVGYGYVWHRPSGEREERAYLMGLVDPDFRGRGIGRAVYAWELERARESLSACDPSLPWFVRSNEWEWIEDAHHLARHFGLEPVRYYKEMLRPLDEPVQVGIPAGVELVPWDRSLDEAARQAQNESFADHWGSTPIDAASYQHRLDGHGVRLDLSLMAMAGGEVVGLCINGVYPDDEPVTGRREGWVETLGVRRAHRGKGIATAMLETSFNIFLDAGMTHSAIGVDADNPTGAFDLYTRLGYQVAQGTVTFQLEVGPAR